MNSVNYFITDPVSIDGEGSCYELIIGLDPNDIILQTRFIFYTVPTWEQLVDAAIKRCHNANVRISVLGVEGTIQRGEGPGRFMFPPCAVLYIAALCAGRPKQEAMQDVIEKDHPKMKTQQADSLY